MFRALIARFHRSDAGVSVVEFALVAPLLSVLLLGGYDLSRYIMLRNSVDKVGFSVADVTSQYDALTSDAMKMVFRITAQGLKTYQSGVNGVTVLTSVYLDGTTPKVRWQCYSTTGAIWKSKIGTTGANATVPSGLLADANDNIVVAELFYKYDPIFKLFVKDGFDIYTKSLYRPRLGNLTKSPCP